MYAKFNGIEIPKVYDVQVSYEFLGERVRTAGGKLRQDSTGVKRTWTLKCRPVPLAVVQPLVNLIKGSFGPEGAFWLQGFGEVTVLCRADAGGLVEKVVAFGKNGVWHKDGREMTFVFEEV